MKHSGKQQMKKIPISDLKKNFSSVITGVEHGARIAVLRYRRPAAALVSIEDHKLIERLRTGAKRRGTKDF
jgi:prevent-host-death family protein